MIEAERRQVLEELREHNGPTDSRVTKDVAEQSDYVVSTSGRLGRHTTWTMLGGASTRYDIIWVWRET